MFLHNRCSVAVQSVAGAASQSRMKFTGETQNNKREGNVGLMSPDKQNLLEDFWFFLTREIFHLVDSDIIMFFAKLSSNW